MITRVNIQRSAMTVTGLSGHGGAEIVGLCLDLK